MGGSGELIDTGVAEEPCDNGAWTRGAGPVGRGGAEVGIGGG